MKQEYFLELLNTIYDENNIYSSDERLSAKLRLEELIRTLVPE